MTARLNNVEQHPKPQAAAPCTALKEAAFLKEEVRLRRPRFRRPLAWSNRRRFRRPLAWFIRQPLAWFNLVLVRHRRVHGVMTGMVPPGKGAIAS